LDGKQIGIYDYLPIGRGLEAGCPPGWRPGAQTRASQPHQAKDGLDGDPGVWAYVCFAYLFARATNFQTQLSRVFFKLKPH